MESISLNLDLDNNEDEDDVEDRQQEIQGLLSTAFDDLSSLSEDEEEVHYNGFKTYNHNQVPKDSNESLQRKFCFSEDTIESLQRKLCVSEDTIESLQRKLCVSEDTIESLQRKLCVSEDTIESLQRKLCLSEDTIESLQYQLMEIGKSDCLVRVEESHQLVVSSLKSKYEKELISVKEEIKALKEELKSKNIEINSIIDERNRLKLDSNGYNFSEQFKDMIKVTKDLWEQEMRTRIENDMKGVIEIHEQNWTKNAKQEMINERNNWDKELQTQVNQLIEFLRIKAKVSADTLPSNITLSFVPLVSLWQALEESCDSKEYSLRIQIERLKEAKTQLEEALNETKLNPSLNRSHNQSNCSSNDQILVEVRNELQKVSEEAVLMKDKLYKYKQHYKQLERRHKHEIQTIKQEFSQILETFKRHLK